jgi:hypothetical protein
MPTTAVLIDDAEMLTNRASHLVSVLSRIHARCRIVGRSESRLDLQIFQDVAPIFRDHGSALMSIFEPFFQDSCLWYRPCFREEKRLSFQRL